MPTSTEQDAASGLPLTNAELGRVMSIVQDLDFAKTKSLCDGLQLLDSDLVPLAEEEQALLQQTRADVSVFFDQYPDGTIRAGEDFDLPRDKEEIRQRIRRRLGLPAVSQTQIDAYRARRRGSQSIDTRTVFNG